jgi:hypothetical protein
VLCREAALLAWDSLLPCHATRFRAASDASKPKGADGARAVRPAALPRGCWDLRRARRRAQAVRAEAARALAGWLLADAAAGAVSDAEAAALALPALPPGARAHHLQAAAAALGAVLG